MTRTLFTKILFAASLSLFAVPASAELKQTNLGKQSKDKIRDACNAAGGTLLGVSDLGSYGCENDKNGTMVLCNKDDQCTGYYEARTKTEINRIAGGLRIKVNRAK